MSLKEFMKSLNDSTTIACARQEDERDLLVFNFSLNDFGFGEVKFVAKEGKLFCDSEGMDRDLVKRILGNFVDSAIFAEDIVKLPELVEYDRAMGTLGRGGLPERIILDPGEILPDYIEKDNG